MCAFQTKTFRNSVKHRDIVGNSKQTSSQNASSHRQKAYCDGIYIERYMRALVGYNITTSFSAERFWRFRGKQAHKNCSPHWWTPTPTQLNSWTHPWVRWPIPFEVFSELAISWQIYGKCGFFYSKSQWIKLSEWKIPFMRTPSYS